MANAKKIEWIALATGMFEDDKIQLIEILPDGDALIVIWIKMLTLAGKLNTGGVLMMTNGMPYTDEMLATIFHRPLAVVRLALATFEGFGMIEYINDVISIPNWEKYQEVASLDKIREQTRVRVQNHRERQKALVAAAKNPQLAEGGEDVTLRNVTVTHHNNNNNNNNKDIDNIDILSSGLPAVMPAINEDLNDGNDKNSNDSQSGDDVADYARKDKKAKKHKYGAYKHVMLTDKEHENLVDKFGPELVDKAIEILDEGIELKGYKYKSHSLALQKWPLDEARKAIGKRGNNNDGYKRNNELDGGYRSSGFNANNNTADDYKTSDFG